MDTTLIPLLRDSVPVGDHKIAVTNSLENNPSF